MPDLLAQLLNDMVWSAIASIGFGVLFSVPRRTLLGCGVAGALGRPTRLLLIEVLGISVEPATLMGAIVVGFVSLALAKRQHAPALVYAICGAIPMVPGLLAYTAILNLIDLTSTSYTGQVGDALLREAVVELFRTMMLLGAIALGITMPRLLFQRDKPVV